MFDSALKLCNCCFVASSVLALSIASSSDSVSSRWISFDCTRSELVPNMRVSSMCSFGVCIYIIVPKGVLFSYTRQHFFHCLVS